MPHDNDITDERGTRAMVLAAICKGWRDVALSTPELWASFRFCMQVDQDLDRLGALKLPLDRSGSFPLTFIITDETNPIYHFDPTTPSNPPPSSAYLDLLFEHAHHLGDASLHLHPDDLCKHLEGVKALPCLHTFRGFELLWLTTTDTFYRAPNFRHLELTGGQMFSSSMEFHWSQLVSINIYEVLTDIADILRRCTQLQQLKIHGVRQLEHDRSLATSHLRSLYLSVASRDVELFEDILNCLTLPFAIRIEVELEDILTVPMPHTTFIRFLGRCEAVEELAIRNFETTYDQLFEYPLIAPSIKRLEATVKHEIVAEEFEKAVKQLLAKSVQLNEVRILAFDLGFGVEYHATKLEANEVSTTTTYLSAALLY